jgi:hypothetical protein
MPDTFVPFASAVKSDPSVFTALKPKTHIPEPPRSEKTAVTPAQASSGATPGNCPGKPIVTLQRNGGAISGIRVQCGCGQVIDLNCVY